MIDVCTELASSIPHLSERLSSWRFIIIIWIVVSISIIAIGTVTVIITIIFFFFVLGVPGRDDGGKKKITGSPYLPYRRI